MMEVALEGVKQAAEKVAECGIQACEEIFEGTVVHATEATESAIHEVSLPKDAIIKPDMALIRRMSLKSLMASNLEPLHQPFFEKSISEYLPECSIGDKLMDAAAIEDVVPKEAVLTTIQKALIVKETGWPDAVLDCIENMEQYAIYKKAELTTTMIDGKPCLIKNIDMDYPDLKTGMTNRQLMENGRSPIDAKTGEKIELHHMGQGFDSPLVELCENSEHGDGNDSILHDKKIESWRKIPEQKNQYNNVERPNHWKYRAKET